MFRPKCYLVATVTHSTETLARQEEEEEGKGGGGTEWNAAGQENFSACKSTFNYV